MFIYFSNPLFLYSVLGLIFNNSIVVYKLIGCHYLSNLVIMFCLNPHSNYNVTNSDSKPMINTLTKAISQSIETNLVVLGTITFFMILQSVIIIPKTIYGKVVIGGLLEVTQGLYLLNNLKNGIIKEIIALIIISFGGLSIHMQIMSCLNNKALKYHNFLFGRIISSILSIVLYALFTCIKV